jgi:hypothetical protein
MLVKIKAIISEDLCLLGCYAVLIGNLLQTIRRSLLASVFGVDDEEFATIFPSNLFFFDYVVDEGGNVFHSVGKNYHSTRCNFPVDFNMANSYEHLEDLLGFHLRGK